jgi:hypothetical protein
MRNPFTGKTVPQSIETATRNPFPVKLTLKPEQPVYYIYADLPRTVQELDEPLPPIAVSDFHPITYSEDQNTELNFLNSIGLLHFSDMNSNTPDYHISDKVRIVYDYFADMENAEKEKQVIKLMRDTIIPARAWRLYFQNSNDIRLHRELDDLKRLMTAVRYQ